MKRHYYPGITIKSLSSRISPRKNLATYDRDGVSYYTTNHHRSPLKLWYDILPIEKNNESNHDLTQTYIQAY